VAGLIAFCFTMTDSDSVHDCLAGSTSMKQIDNMAKLESAGSGGLLYLPYLNGMSYQSVS
jgi:hypothetical protein